MILFPLITLSQLVSFFIGAVSSIEAADAESIEYLFWAVTIVSIDFGYFTIIESFD